MPIYEYRPKSGECKKCGGCFSDLQKVSDPAHVECPTCGVPCERMISVPMAPSIRGAEFKAAENSEKRGRSVAAAKAELKESRAKGHNHNCALYGCYGGKSSDKAR